MALSSQERFTLIGLPAEKRLAKFARNVAAGLSASPKYLPCCYFYDRLGSLLFEAICDLPEYYLTRAETAILKAHAQEIAALFPTATDLIELGSGTAAKTRLLLEAFLGRHGRQLYVPVDICRTVLEESALDLLKTYPALEVLAIAGDYQEGLAHLDTVSARPKLILWLGSNIGNLERPAAARFLSRIRQNLSPGDHLLAGIDLRKDPAILQAAYDDACGVTAAFNRNLLLRINRELGGHFDPRTFQHRAVYNEELGRIEMYLVSEVAGQVAIEHLGRQIPFAAGEPVHTEDSYKYAPVEIEALAAAAGMHCERKWFDAENRFSLVLMAFR
jgi:dimethylhistidine N-methyltransferase